MPAVHVFKPLKGLFTYKSVFNTPWLGYTIDQGTQYQGLRCYCYCKVTFYVYWGKASVSAVGIVRSESGGTNLLL
jgi:hypothetical protein